MSDLFGLGWRPELALDLHRHGDQVDLLEFIAEDWLTATPARLETLTAWCRERPVHLHGTTLGLASAAAVDAHRLQAWRRLLEAVRPRCWSEHLAFVRGGGTELGHLAAPPRSAATIMGTCTNLERIRSLVGSLPLLENVATLLEPPGSELDEPSWLSAIAIASGARLVLDLHNLHANATNQGWDAVAALRRLPLDQVAAVHLAGGRRWRGRVLDDHLHPVPEAVFALLEELAALAPGPLEVIIERDGGFPPFAELLAELAQARRRVAAGRARRSAAHPAVAAAPAGRTAAGGSRAAVSDPAAISLEAFLARLYTQPRLREAFLRDRARTARAAGLSLAASAGLAGVDLDGVLLTADSLAAKRAGRTEAG